MLLNQTLTKEFGKDGIVSIDALLQFKWVRDEKYCIPSRLGMNWPCKFQIEPSLTIS